MIKKNDRNEKQNKGFTLIEVLIAVTILAVIVAPLLHAFVTGAKTNAKAKQIMKSTTLAQNVMEQIKAYSVEDIARQFNDYPIMTYKAATKEFEPVIDTTMLNDADVHYEAVKNAAGALEQAVTSKNAASGSTVNSSIRDAANKTINPDGVFVGQKSGEYHFRLNGVPMESNKYDIDVELKVNSENGSHMMADINAMNRSDCAYYAQLNSESIAANEFDLRNDAYVFATAKLAPDDFRQMMTRKIVVDIADDGTGYQDVTVTYTYKIPAGYTTVEDQSYTEFSTIFDNYGSKEPLKAVYLYYSPLYGTGRDTIEVHNTSNLDIDFYLIKTMGTNQSASAELTYITQFILKENSAVGGNANITVCSNISDENIVESHVVSSGTPGIITIKDLGNEKMTEYLYDVKVQVYKADTVNPYTKENLLTTLTGSKLDNSIKKGQ